MCPVHCAGYLLYFCKAGDGTVDLQLIWDLHKSEVFAVGAYLGVPESILVAPPSADLWEGQVRRAQSNPLPPPPFLPASFCRWLCLRCPRWGSPL
jgi:hypothetical protein